MNFIAKERSLIMNTRNKVMSLITGVLLLSLPLTGNTTGRISVEEQYVDGEMNGTLANWLKSNYSDFEFGCGAVRLHTHRTSDIIGKELEFDFWLVGQTDARGPSYFAYQKILYAGKGIRAEDRICKLNILQIDLSDSKLIAAIDVISNNEETDNKDVVLLRQLVEISGQATDYAGALRAKSLGSGKIDTVGRALTVLLNWGKGLGQRRYEDGTIKVKKLSTPPLVNPLGNENLTIIGAPSNSYNSENRYSSRGSTFDFEPKFEPGVDHSDKKELYKAIEKTLELLWDAFDGLKLVSDEEAQEAFYGTLMQNKHLIREEFSELIDLIRKNPYHPMEVLHLVNSLTNLIASIDEILKGDAGSLPDFATIIEIDE